MRIQKAKLKDGKLEVTFTERKEDGTDKTVTETHETIAHADLLQAYKNLRVHFGLLAGFVSIKAIKRIETPPEEITDELSVSGITIKTGSDEGVTITGYYTNPLTQKPVNTNTPFTRYSDEYKFKDDLIEKIDRANVEIAAYLDGSKNGNPQQSLPFDSAGNTPQNRLPEDLESEEVPDEDKVWQNNKRPVAGTIKT